MPFPILRNTPYKTENSDLARHVFQYVNLGQYAAWPSSIDDQQREALGQHGHRLIQRCLRLANGLRIPAAVPVVFALSENWRADPAATGSAVVRGGKSKRFSPVKVLAGKRTREFSLVTEKLDGFPSFTTTQEIVDEY